MVAVNLPCAPPRPGRYIAAGCAPRGALASHAMLTASPSTPAPLDHLGRGSPKATEPSSYRVAAGWVIAALWIAAIVYVVALSAITRVGLGALVVQQVALLLLWGIATPAIIWSAERLPIERARWLPRVLVHGAIATAFIVALN